MTALRREVLELAGRQRARTRDELAQNQDEIDVLLESVSGVLPEWAAAPCLFRVALLREPAGAEPFVENLVLPNVKHDLEMVLDMVNYIRKQKGLPEATMPLFLQPDEISVTLRRATRGLPAPSSPTATPSEELELMNRRSWPLGRRGQAWKRVRSRVLDRDSWQCSRCGTDKDLHLHAVARELAFDDPNRYITLCRTCRAHAEAAQYGVPADAEGSPSANGADGARVAIRSQLALVFQRGAINWVGFVFGRNYVVLKK